MIKCACLVDIVGNTVLLVRARDNDVWYFPGGKIDAGETPTEALSRELEEELGITLSVAEFEHIGTVSGPNHDRTAEAELICYRAPHVPDVKAQAEITGVERMRVTDRARMAPLVEQLLDSLAL